MLDSRPRGAVGVSVSFEIDGKNCKASCVNGSLICTLMMLISEKVGGNFLWHRQEILHTLMQVHALA